MNKKVLLNTLADYFITKGKILTKREYMHETDTPIRHAIITRAISWGRLESMIKRNLPEKYEQIINPVVKEVPEKYEQIINPVVKEVPETYEQIINPVVKEVPKVPSQLLTKGAKNEI